jgi:hypothetical protein
MGRPLQIPPPQTHAQALRLFRAVIALTVPLGGTLFENVAAKFDNSRLLPSKQVYALYLEAWHLPHILELSGSNLDPLHGMS